MSSRMKISICFARGNVVGDGVAAGLPGVAERQRQIVGACAWRWRWRGQARASGDWDEQELPVNELEHAALLRLDRHLGIDLLAASRGYWPRGSSSRILREPGFERP